MIEDHHIMLHTADNIRPGQCITVFNQGSNITPISKTVKIHWVGPTSVYYFLDGSNTILNTSIDRFLEIVNAGK
jgi:hypothetical protein